MHPLRGRRGASWTGVWAGGSSSASKFGGYADGGPERGQRVNMKDRLGQLLTRKLILNPIFVVGMGRSGTSVLLSALGLHPLVLSTKGEAPLIPMFGLLVEPLEHSDERDYYLDSLNVPKEYLYRHLQRTCFEYVAGPNYGLDQIIAEVRTQRRLEVLKRRCWCAKTFPAAGAYNGIRQLYPGASFIYIIRNGIDMVHSRTQYAGFKDQSFEEHCEAWVAGAANFGYLGSAEAAIQVRHEDLVDTPEQVLREVFDCAGIGYDQRPAAFLKETMLMPLGQPTEIGVDVKAILKRRRPAFESWTPEQRATFKRIAGDTMRETGYEIPF